MGTPISSYPDYIQRQLREQIEADKARRAAQCQTCKGALTIKVNGKTVRCFECRGKNDSGKVIQAKRSKYGNIRTAFKSIQGFERVYDSMGEANYAATLDHGIQAGLVEWWIPQPVFPLPGDKRSYRGDFLIVWTDKRTTVADFKGADTPKSKDRRKEVKAHYGIDVEIVRKA